MTVDARDTSQHPANEPLVRVSFVPTLDERADVAVRLAELSPALRARNRRTIAVMSAVGAVIAGAAVFFVLRWFNPDRWPTGMLAAAAIVALYMAWRGPALLRKAHWRQVRKAMADMFGAGEHPFVVALYPDRVTADAGRFALAIQWRHVVEVRVTGGDVELRSNDALVVVRARAFASPDAAKTFRDTAEGLRTAAPAAVGSR